MAKVNLTIEQLNKLADFYIETNCSMGELPGLCGIAISRSTILRYFSGKRALHLDEERQAAVNGIIAKHSEEGRKNSPRNSGKRRYSDLYLRKLAQRYVDEGLTLRELAGTRHNIGTLYLNFTEDILGSELYAQVVERYSINNERGNIKNFLKNGNASDSSLQQNGNLGSDNIVSEDTASSLADEAFSSMQSGVGDEAKKY